MTASQTDSPLSIISRQTDHRRERANICVLGASLDVGNRGVLALGVSLARLLGQSAKQVQLSFLYWSAAPETRRVATDSGDVEITVRNCRMSPRSKPSEHIAVIFALALLYRLGFRKPALNNAWLRALIEADFIGDIRGGDSFSDIYGFRRFVLGNLPLLTVVVLGRPYVMLPQTYGPFRSRASRLVTRFLLKRAVSLFTRDRNCEATVRDLCGRTPTFCPDVAFTLGAVQPKNLSVVPEGLDLSGDSLVVGLNVSGLLYIGGYNGRNMFGLRCDYREMVNSLIESILTSTSAKVLLVPHVFGREEYEEEACSVLLDTYKTRYPGRVFAISTPLTESEVKWVIGRTDFFVGSRMHACIAALSQFIPTVGLAYSDKFFGVFDSTAVASSTVDLRTATVADVTSHVHAALERRVTVRALLQARIPEVQQTVRLTFRGLVPAAAVK